jgi:hypothetical protein
LETNAENKLLKDKHACIELSDEYLLDILVAMAEMPIFPSPKPGMSKMSNGTFSGLPKAQPLCEETSLVRPDTVA